MDRRTAMGHLLAIFVIAVWGSTYVISKDLMNYVTPIQLMVYRFAIATVVLWLICPRWHFNLKEEGWFVLIAFFANTLFYITTNFALTITNATDVSILSACSPIITAVLLVAIAKDVLSKKQVAGVAFAFIGVVLVILNGSLVLDLNPIGYVIGLGAALSWSIYGLLLRKFKGCSDSFVMTRKIMFYGLLTTLPFMLVEGAPVQTDMLFRTDNIMALLYLAIIASGICFLLWDVSVRRLSVLQTNLYIDAMPISTLVVAAIVSSEPITAMAVVGLVLVLLGLFLGNSQPSAESPE